MHAIAERFSQSGMLGRHAGRPRDQRAQWDVDVFGERPRALHAEHLALGAQVRVAASAAHAPAAWHQRVAHHTVADPPGHLACTRRLGAMPVVQGCDLAAEFVAHDQRRRAAWAVMAKRLELAAADTDRSDLQQGLALGQLRHGPIDDLKRVPGGIEQCFHFWSGTR
jgi:hypothetical protein